MLSNKTSDGPTARAQLGAFARTHMSIVVAVAIVVATVAVTLFWLWPRHAAVHSSAARPRDLEQLFKDGAGGTLDGGDFIDLRDPGCTRSFALRLTQAVFIRMSRNCTYAISIESGRARANFLDPAKGAVDLAPGHGWSAADFWSLTPLTSEALVRLDPNT